MRNKSVLDLLSGLDDDLIAEATLPDEAVPIPRIRRRGRRPMDWLNDTRVAVVASITVALAVLLGIVAAGRMVPAGGPPAGTMDSETDPPFETEPVIQPPEDGRTTILETEGNSLSVLSDGMEVHPAGYCLWRNEVSYQEGEYVTYEYDDGSGAVNHLSELIDFLPVLKTSGQSYTIYLPKNMVINEVRLFEVRSGGLEFAEIALPVNLGAALDYALTNREGDYVVVLDITSEVVEMPDLWWGTHRTEYTFRLIVGDGISEDENTPVTNATVSAGNTTIQPQSNRLSYEAVLPGQDGQMMQAQEVGDSVMADPWKALSEAPHMTVPCGKTYTIRLPQEFYLKGLEIYGLWDSESNPSLGSVSRPNNSWSWTEWLANLDIGTYLVVIHATREQVYSEESYEREVREYVFSLTVTDTPDTTAEPITDEIEPDMMPEPDMEEVLSVAHPMAPDISADADLVGKTALYTMFYEDGVSQMVVSRVAVFRDEKNPYIHYLYIDALANNGEVLLSETRSIYGFFVLLRHIDPWEGMIFATLEGWPAGDGNTCQIHSILEQWYSWCDTPNYAGEDIGDPQFFYEQTKDWMVLDDVNILGQTRVKQAGKYWAYLSARMKSRGGAENYRILVDYISETDTPHVYSYAESEATNAETVSGDITQSDRFEVLWDEFINRLKEQRSKG